ncbi:probable inactive peptidyl-prolyl cis-trans isomerase-like 6 [Strongylocentrotus purpuratus]|uniref:Peptidyl-prolyl cis-trans isomerase n=1 Tax=Strongylocentrotus purpuratus TaxID=7668 RepID=A0A7M7PFK3_STRPU|nr:probable inactive peptidyl-prolyl cis-trans isomerase-like 6 [Strongylocentrotus purpuratus]
MAGIMQFQLTVIGLLPNETFHIARCCAEALYQSNPEKFKTPDIRGLLEFEWEEYVEEQRKALRDETWVFTEKAMTYVNGEFLGGPEALKQWSEQHFNYVEYKPLPLYMALAEEAYKEHILATKHTFVYFDVTVDGEKIGRLLFELFTDQCPRTCENFRALCTGEKGQKTDDTLMKFHYLESLFHRIVPNGWVQGGDILYGKGDGGESIHGPVFEDENFSVKHNARGVLGMGNKGRHTNGSQFYITCQPAPWMDSKFVAFGKLVEGTEVLKTLEGQETYNERPKKDCKIAACGVFVPED